MGFRSERQLNIRAMANLTNVSMSSLEDFPSALGSRLES